MICYLLIKYQGVVCKYPKLGRVQKNDEIISRRYSKRASKATPFALNSLTVADRRCAVIFGKEFTKMDKWRQLEQVRILVTAPTRQHNISRASSPGWGWHTAAAVALYFRHKLTKQNTWHKCVIKIVTLFYYLIQSQSDEINLIQNGLGIELHINVDISINIISQC